MKTINFTLAGFLVFLVAGCGDTVTPSPQADTVAAPAPQPPSPPPENTVKRITCEEEQTVRSIAKGSQVRKMRWSAIVDTKDFSKDMPEYEWTLEEYSYDGVSSPTQPIGSTFRYTYDVTSSVISFSHCGQFQGGRCGGSSYSNMVITNVSREDLSIPFGECSISDYEVQNKI